MRVHRIVTSALAGALFLAGPTVSRADTNKEVTSAKTSSKTNTRATDGDKAKTEPVAADNTGTNKRDRADNAKTADQAKNDKSDVQVAAEIRRAVVDDKSLSTNAHNVKIIVEDDRVTLKGPVASKAEKATIAKKAADVVGRRKVVDEMSVAP